MPYVPGAHGLYRSAVPKRRLFTSCELARDSRKECAPVSTGLAPEAASVLHAKHWLKTCLQSGGAKFLTNMPWACP